MDVTQTLDHIVYNIADAMEREKDAQFLQRLRYNVLYYRALFIRRDMARNNFFSPQIVQTISGLKTEKVSAAETLGINLKDYKIRTSDNIPEVIRLAQRHAFYYVGSVDKLITFSYIDPRRINYLRYEVYSQKKPRYTYINKKIYLIGAAPTDIAVMAAFQDPTQLSSFSDEFGDPAYEDNHEFPMPIDMVQGITTGLLSGELKLVGDGQTNEININE